MAQTIAELQAEELTLEVAKLFPRQGKWTEKDYFSLPETNRIVELSEGRLIITPAPTDLHQRVSFKLTLLIGNYVLANSLGEVRCAPLDVWLYEDTVRQPDIVFMKHEHRDSVSTRGLRDSDYNCRVGIAHQLTEFDGCGIMNRFKRITFNPNIMSGQACIRGMRIPVSLVINLVANGMTTDEIIKEYPSLELVDIREALQYDSWLAKDKTSYRR